jgi:predicted RNase H-like HicB family nuclease
MNEIEKYHKWVEWSEEDRVYIGKCPDLITGIHGDDPVALYGELLEVLAEVVTHFQQEGQPLPPAKVRPMREVA